MASVANMNIINDKPSDADKMAAVVTVGGEGYIPLGELIDIAKEKERLKKEIETLISEIKRAEGKLNNQSFVAKAPEKVINAEKEKYEKYTEMLKNVKDRMSALEEM